MASIPRVLYSSSRGSISNFKVVALRFPNIPKDQTSKVFRQSLYTSTNALKVLNESTALVQDGINIKEFPILIRRIDKSSFPFTSHSYTGENIRDINDFEVSFKQILHDCKTVSDVFKLLEVPPDKVEGYSAAFALQRLHTLMYLNTEWLQIHSFIRTAVMKELYETVQRDIRLISNSTLVNLIDCYLATQGFSPSCIDAINDEIMCRLVAGVFQSEELLSLIQSLSSASSRSTNNIFPPLSKHQSLSEVLFENASKYLASDPPPKENVEPFDKFMAKASHPMMREVVKSKCLELLRNAWVHLSTR